MESAYRLDVNGNAIPVRNGRPCTVCSNFDRKAIDRMILEGIPNARIASEYHIKVDTLKRHIARGHISNEVARAQAKATRFTANDLLEKLEATIDRTEARAENAPIQYYPNVERVKVQSITAYADINFKGEQLRMERDKFDASKQKQAFDLPAIIDWLRTEHPNIVQAFINRFGTPNP
jgi:hypothetical protein